MESQRKLNLDGLLKSRWKGRNKERNVFRMKDEDDRWRTAIIIPQARSARRRYRMARRAEFRRLPQGPSTASPLLCVCTFCSFIFIPFSTHSFPHDFLATFFSFKYQVKNDLFCEALLDPSGKLGIYSSKF